jgi:ABC-2 type transport system permease protein
VSFVNETGHSFKRWMLHALRNPWVVGFGIIQPLVWLFLFPKAMGGVSKLPLDYTVWFAPVVVIQTALFASSGSGIGLVEDMRMGMFNKMLASPMSRGAFFLGKSLAEAVVIAVQVAFILVLAVLAGGTAAVSGGLLGAAGVILLAVLFALGFSGFSNIVAIATRDTQATILAVNFLALPLLFTAGTFAPVSTLPTWLQWIARFNPVTYGTEAARHMMLPAPYSDSLATHALGFDLAVLVAFDLVLVAIAATMLRTATSAKTARSEKAIRGAPGT